jgi:hypothetical protein
MFEEVFLSGLLAQMKGESLMLVSKTADGFRDRGSALRSLYVRKGVSLKRFHSRRTDASVFF